MFPKQNLIEACDRLTTFVDDKNPLFSGILAFAAAAFRKTLRQAIAQDTAADFPPSSRLSASDPIMLERNRLQPPRPSAPLQTAGGLDGPATGCAGLFASPEDYDATGILAGVDPYESCYWWMPDLYTTPTTTSITAAAEADTGAPARRSGLAEWLKRAGQAARRTPSRSTAAA